jgi:hypothetical protein
VGWAERARRQGLSTPDVNPVPVIVEITLRLRADGRMEIGGPLDDPVAFLGLLELAKERYADIRRRPKPAVVGAAQMPTLPPSNA